MVQVKLGDAPFLQPKTLRVRFEKRGRAQFISHLDLVRTMNRAILRARIPVYYSEGFHPIPRFSFAAPLSLGVESLCEVMDVRVTHPVDAEAALQNLRSALPPELFVTDVYMAEEKATAIHHTDYRICFSGVDALDILAECKLCLTKKPLFVWKNTKNGEKETDISSVIASVSGEAAGDSLILTVSLLCPNAAFLNPEYTVAALKAGVPALADHQNYTIVRIGMYREDGSPFR